MIYSKIIGILAEAELLHPYKFQGHPETYSEYNEGWMDAIVFIDARVSALHEEYIKDLAMYETNTPMKVIGCFCPVCGVEIADDTKYCYNCGQKLDIQD